MKNKIQELIQWAGVREKAYSAFVKVFTTGSARSKAQGKLAECVFWKQKLELLLNEQPEAITEDAHLRKHDVRRSAACDEGQIIGDSGADSSETAAVRQNEKTRELCPKCNNDSLISLSTGIHCMDERCGYVRT